MLRLIFCFYFYTATFGLVEWSKPLLAATADEAAKSLRNLSAPQRKSLLEERARKEGETNALKPINKGFAVAGSLTLIGTLLGEMFASQFGLGNVLMRAIGLHNVDLIMSITFILIVFAAVVSSALLIVDRRLHRQV